jgi:cell shape-determining protein MreD
MRRITEFNSSQNSSLDMEDMPMFSFHGAGMVYYSFYKWLDGKTAWLTRGMVFTSVAAVVCVGAIPAIFSALIYFAVGEKMQDWEGGVASGVLLLPHIFSFIYLEVCDAIDRRSR